MTLRQCRTEQVTAGDVLETVNGASVAGLPIETVQKMLDAQSLSLTFMGSNGRSTVDLSTHVRCLSVVPPVCDP